MIRKWAWGKQQEKSCLWTNRDYGALPQIFQIFMFEYFWINDIIEKYFASNSTAPSKSFKNITTGQKSYYMRHFEVSSDLVGGNGILYARGTWWNLVCSFHIDFTTYMEWANKILWISKRPYIRSKILSWQIKSWFFKTS